MDHVCETAVVRHRVIDSAELWSLGEGNTQGGFHILCICAWKQFPGCSPGREQKLRRTVRSPCWRAECSFQRQSPHSCGGGTSSPWWSAGQLVSEVAVREAGESIPRAHRGVAAGYCWPSLAAGTGNWESLSLPAECGRNPVCPGP